MWWAKDLTDTYNEAVEEELETMEFVPDEDSYTLNYVFDIRKQRDVRKSCWKEALDVVLFEHSIGNKIDIDTESSEIIHTP